MQTWIAKKWSGEWGVYFRFISTLLLIVAGVFAYFSVIGCGDGGTSGCGPPGAIGTISSDFTQGRSINSPPYNLSLSGTGSAILNNDPLGSAVLPGSVVTRYINYAAEAGKDPTRIEWTPPPGASNVNFFSTPPTNPGGPAPFIFDNDPPLALPLHITYNAPQLPSYASSQVVGEIIVAARADYTDDIHALNLTISAAATRIPAASLPAITQPGLPAAPIAALEVQRWYGVQGSTLTTALCQQLYDWLQSDSTFTAMRMPVSTGGLADQSYELPVLFPVDSNLSANLIDARPKMNLNVTGIPDLPLEVRSDRIAFMENHLPSAAGEHWVALGVAKQPKITCPAALNKLYWEFNFEFSVNPATPIAALPLYYCQEGQDAPPIGGLLLNLMAIQADGAAPLSTQLEGITCLGPQEHTLNTNPVIHVGNPNMVWNVYPADEIRLKHYVQVIGLAPTIQFFVNSDIAAAGWKLYEGSDDAPNLAREVDMTQAYTASPGLMFFWLINTIPAGTSPGYHHLTLRVEKSDDTSKYGSSADMLWVGEWVPPPPLGGESHVLFLPVINRP